MRCLALGDSIVVCNEVDPALRGCVSVASFFKKQK